MVGWLPGQGTHKDLGSLIVAVNDDSGLRHAGQVGSGMVPACARSCWRPWSRSGGMMLRWSKRPAVARALGRAADRDPRRVHRLDARRAAAPGGLQGDRAGPRSREGRARGGGTGRAGRPAAPSANRRPSKRPAPADGPADPSAKAVSSSKEAWPSPEMDLTPASRAELKALDGLEREALDGGRPRGAGHQPGQGAHPGRWRAGRCHQRPAALLRDHRPHHAAAPRGSRAEPAALPGRHRQDGLLAEGRARPRPKWVSRWSYTGHEGKKDYVVVDKVATLAGSRRRPPWSCIPGRPARSPHEPTLP